MAQEKASSSTPRLVAIGVYGAYLLGAFTGLFWMVGLIAAYIFRENAKDDPLAMAHLNHQVRIGVKLLIAGVAAMVLYLLLVVTLIGVVVAWIPLLAWWVWALVVAVKGLAALMGDREPG